jgi:hypothetical protein
MLSNLEWTIERRRQTHPVLSKQSSVISLVSHHSLTVSVPGILAPAARLSRPSVCTSIRSTNSCCFETSDHTLWDMAHPYLLKDCDPCLAVEDACKTAQDSRASRGLFGGVAMAADRPHESSSFGKQEAQLIHSAQDNSPIVFLRPRDVAFPCAHTDITDYRDQPMATMTKITGASREFTAGVLCNWGPRRNTLQ